MYQNNGDVPRYASPGPAPVPVAYGSQPAGQWTTGLCDCCEDTSSCMTTWCCPFITFGRNAEIIDRGKTSCGSAGCKFYILSCFAFLYSCTYRTKLRAHYNLPEEPCKDCCVHCFCTACAICQEYRELKNRGLDPALGWTTHSEKMNNNGNFAAPNVVPSMYR
ncbi:hypothetical protein UlMin_008519 [Ulmus minor]